jgi:hypothetical protein
MSNDFTTTFSVEQEPGQVFGAINNVRAWWSGNVEGRTDELGAEFTYEVPGIHYTKLRITELAPDRSVAWLVLDSNLSFTEDKEEWTGTTIRFDIVADGGPTQVRFTHQGLVPVVECFEVCSTAWGQYINGSLRDLITAGAGAPNSFEGEEALEAVEASHAK